MKMMIFCCKSKALRENPALTKLKFRMTCAHIQRALTECLLSPALREAPGVGVVRFREIQLRSHPQGTWTYVHECVSPK